MRSTRLVSRCEIGVGTKGERERYRWHGTWTMPPFKLEDAGHKLLEGALAGRSILIVEDEPLVALGVHGALSAAGGSIISAASATEAKSLIGYAEIAAAVVDIRLGGEDASEVCTALARRRIPFVFYTGSHDAPLLAAWPGVPVIRKPARPEELVSVLASLLH
jgi:CheY-like chemotaxis protein